MYYLRIKNFKCFNEIKIPLNTLTVLTGANGNGKSTVIQTLLFLRRTIEHCASWEKGSFNLEDQRGLNVELNGAYCLALGNSSMIIPKNSASENTLVGLFLDNEEKEHLDVGYNIPMNELWLTPNYVSNNSTKYFPLNLQEFYYLNAERIGPRISQSIKFFDYPSAGFQGEYVAQLIADTEKNYRFKVEEKRKLAGSENPRLEQQVNAWMNYLMPGVTISASYNQETHSAQIRVDNKYTNGDYTTAPNIGFGISYVLPIVVTGLIARKGAFMIVENPEAHLHPSAQSKIGCFLAMVANAGVTVIIETHSDHVVNGIQLSVAKKEINSDKVTINFFSQEDSISQPKVDSLSINDKGELSNWPKGFFDQTQKDYSELFKFRKG